jgi:hypothetical protein
MFVRGAFSSLPSSAFNMLIPPPAPPILKPEVFMTEQELRAWSLAISAILQKDKSIDLAKLVESAAAISGYIKTGDVPPKKLAEGLYPKDEEQD